MTLCVGVVGKPQEQARLAHTRVTDEDELEYIVILLPGSRGPKSRFSSHDQPEAHYVSPGRCKPEP